jgi:hypothetical protein
MICKSTSRCLCGFFLSPKSEDGIVMVQKPTAHKDIVLPKFLSVTVSGMLLRKTF